MAEEVKLTRKEKRLKKKEEKKARRLQEKEFERNAGHKPQKILSLVLGIVGFVIGFIPIMLIILSIFFFIICACVSAVLFIVDIAGLIFFGLGYIIYASSTSNASLDGYFAPAQGPINFAADIFNKVVNVNGLLTTIFAGAGLALEIAALILLIVSYKALIKRHKVGYTILLGFAIAITLGVLVIGIRAI